MMRRELITAALVLMAITQPCWAQSEGLAAGVLRLDSRLDAVVTQDAVLEVLRDDYFGATEGPVWVRDVSGGYLLFSDMAANTIYRYSPEDGFSTFLTPAGHTGTSRDVGAIATNGRLWLVYLGSNGLTLDPEGRLLMVAMGDRQIVRLESDGTRTVLAERYEGRRINGGNDLVAKSNGSVYFTDGTGALRGREASPDKELPFDGVFLIKDGTLTLLDQDPQGGTPNGVALSPDERYLYVVSARRFITRYEVQADDTIANGELFIELTGDEVGGGDGVKVDTLGNVYVTGPGGIWVISPQGEHLGTIRIPPPIPPTNLAFGDEDGRSLYITSRTGLMKIRLNVEGIRPGPTP